MKCKKTLGLRNKERGCAWKWKPNPPTLSRLSRSAPMEPSIGVLVISLHFSATPNGKTSKWPLSEPRSHVSRLVRLYQITLLKPVRRSSAAKERNKPSKTICSAVLPATPSLRMATHAKKKLPQLKRTL